MKIFESNYIDKSCLTALLHDDIQLFFDLRKELIRVDIERLTGQKSIPKTEVMIEKYSDEDDT